jgi:hypothetical protein
VYYRNIYYSNEFQYWLKKKEIIEIKDVTEWIYKNIKHKKGELMPDGTDPNKLIKKWFMWVEDCVMLMDTDCTFRLWKYRGSYSEQPYIDLQIYKVIRAKWVTLKNETNEKAMKGFKKGNKSKYRRGRKWQRR